MQNPHSRDAGRVRSGSASDVRVGDRVRVRRQHWAVVAAEQYDACRMLMLSGIGSHNTGTGRRVLEPFESIERLERSARPQRVRWRRWRVVCRNAIARSGAAGTLRATARAGIELMPHQLEPALAILHGAGSRVLLADEVGLGKTIQAGVALSELQQLGAAERVLVLAPAGLREQWAEELAGRFGLSPTILDMRDLRRRAAELPIGLNPWTTVPLAIASIDYVKRPEVLPAVLSCRWDVVVVDEAHGVTPGSDRREATASLCRRAPYVLLLTATPHNGDHRAFVSLCGLGRVDRDSLLVFRRSRLDVSIGVTRRVHRLMVHPTAAERRLHELLAAFARAVRAERGESDRAAWLALTVLHKRAFSSPHSLEQSLIRRLSVLGSDTPQSEHQVSLPLDDPTGDLTPADEPPVIETPLLTDVGRERRHLLLLAEAAHATRGHESKLVRLARLVARLQRLREPAIIFTEYRDTLLHVAGVLRHDCAILHGGLTRAERRAALGCFASGQRPLLLATDAAGEGLNLQSGCRVVINLELPWNPTRLEQRIGRVDRIGQRRTVHAVHLIADHTGETRILERLRARVAQANAEVGAPDTLGPTDRSEPNSLGPDSARSTFVPAVFVGHPSGSESEPDSLGSNPVGPTFRSGVVTGRPFESEEVATSQAVMGYSAEKATGSAAATDEDDEGVTFFRLRAEAALEYSRLIRARVFGEEGHAAMAAGTLVTHARRPALRAFLGRRTLVLMQTVYEDGCGRIVAEHLTPLIIQRRSIELPQGLDAVPLADIDAALRDWHALTLRVHHAFWARRLAREQAIGRTLIDGDAEVFQPGLFDRRADRAHMAVAHGQAQLKNDVLRRIVLVEAAANAKLRSGRPLLILLPQ